MKIIKYEKPGIEGLSTDLANVSAPVNVELETELLSEQSFDQYTICTVGEFWLSNELIDYITSVYGKPDVILNQFYTRIDLDTDIPICLTDYFFTRFVSTASKFATVDSNAIKTCSSFNFMINRKRINRHLMIKILEHFDLIRHAKYTWSKSDSNFDLSLIVQELDSISHHWAQDLKSTILYPIELDKNWIDSVKDEIVPDVNVKTLNSVAWNQGLCSIFNDTAVSLISESVDYQSGIGFTEKSIYPILGLNLPIWVGGKYQAEEFEKFGFDVFSDIIDHRYQYCDTLIERCYRAIADNIDILSNVELAAKIRQNVMPRLLQNRDLLMKISNDTHTQHQRIIDSINQFKDVPEIMIDYSKKLFMRKFKSDEVQPQHP